MPTFNGTANNDTWAITDPGTYIFNGLDGVDTLNFGTDPLSNYRIVRNPNGSVQVDSMSGASSSFQATLSNMEILKFSNGRDVIDLRTFFGDTTPPTLAFASPVDEAVGVAIGVNIELTFSETISRGTGIITIKTAAGSVIESIVMATSANVSLVGTKLTINPTADLAYGTTYVVDVGAKVITDTAGNAYVVSNVYNFTTQAAPPINPIAGTSGNDRLVSTSGNDAISGGAGTDTAVYAGLASQYRIAINRGSQTATVTDTQSGRDGRDTLVSVEKLQFGIQTFDLSNPARTEAPQFGKSQTFLFDASYFLLSNPTLATSLTLNNAAQYYMSTAAAQGKTPNAWFDPVYYANRWSDLKNLNLDAATLFAHYNLFGVWEGRSAGPIFDKFDGNAYLAANLDVEEYVDGNVKDFLGNRTNGAIAHYVIYGANEGRVAHDTTGAVIPADFTIEATLVGVGG